MNRKNEVIAALDLGTTKVVMLVAEPTQTGVNVLGVGKAACEGLRKGRVISINKTMEAILRAKHDAEQMSGCEIAEVIVGVGGHHIVGVGNRGLVTTKHSEIKRADVFRVLDAASVVAMPLDRVLINVVPSQYVVDEHDGIKDPVGMSGVRLEVEVHLITAARSALDNITKCVERAGLRVAEFVANPLASALAVLEENEKELGVAVLDLGHGCGDLTVWYNGSLIHTTVVAAGGGVITQDIATGLRTPHACAEQLKIQHGVAWQKMVRDGETIEVPSVVGPAKKTLPKHVITEIVEPRMTEIFGLVRSEIEKAIDKDLLAAGVVVTGGAAKMPGVAELGDEVLNLPVRVGTPRNVAGVASMVSDPAFSTAYGLAVYASLPHRADIPWPMLPVRQLRRSKGFSDLWRRFTALFF